MISHSNATPLTFPVDFYDLPWAAGIADTTLDELVALFGEPTGLPDPGDPGPIERWAFRYDCGLQLIYQLDIYDKQTLVIPDIPEIEHVARHLPFSTSRVTLMPDDELRDQVKLALSMYPDRETEFDALAVAQVWRQGDDGNEIPVGQCTSERSAKCHVAELESHGHKQTYWYTTR